MKNPGSKKDDGFNYKGNKLPKKAVNKRGAKGTTGGSTPTTGELEPANNEVDWGGPNASDDRMTSKARAAKPHRSRRG